MPDSATAVGPAEATRTTRLIRGPAGMLHVDDVGSGGLPVVFVHSFGGSSSHWKAQLAHLRTQRRVIALDLRAHGASTVDEGATYAVRDFAADIGAVVDSLGLNRFVLVGHSLGGAASLVFAGMHADRVAGLVLVGTPGYTPPAMSDPIIAALESATYQQVMDDYMTKLTAGAMPEVAREVDAGVKRISREQSLAIIKATFAYDPKAPLASYRGPTLSITAASEADAPTALHNLSSTIEHKSISGTSHWMQMDRPEIFNAMLDAFLALVT